MIPEGFFIHTLIGGRPNLRKILFTNWEKLQFTKISHLWKFVVLQYQAVEGQGGADIAQEGLFGVVHNTPYCGHAIRSFPFSVSQGGVFPAKNRKKKGGTKHSLVSPRSRTLLPPQPSIHRPCQFLFWNHWFAWGLQVLRHSRGRPHRLKSITTFLMFRTSVVFRHAMCEGVDVITSKPYKL